MDLSGLLTAVFSVFHGAIGASSKTKLSRALRLRNLFPGIPNDRTAAGAGYIINQKDSTKAAVSETDLCDNFLIYGVGSVHYILAIASSKAHVFVIVRVHPVT